MSSKTLYLIRHAESLQNVAVKRLTDQGDLSALLPIIRIGHDAALSELGESQLLPAQEFLKKNEWTPRPGEGKPQLIVHSPLLRAKQTAMGLFNGCDSIPIMELHCLVERTAFEYLYVTPLDTRISQANEWLRSRSEETIVIVGHGQFFRRWLGLAYTQNNVHVMECSWTQEGGIGLISQDPLQLSLSAHSRGGVEVKERNGDNEKDV
jgi:broad specificity phosphatase PhoE